MAVRRIALTFVGVPYLWGGRTPFGMDCSGFTQRVHALCGIALPRDACQQAAFPGSRLLGEEPTRAGDLLFFAGDRDPRGRGITHVGMVLDHPLFIHASGSAGVAVSSLEEGPYRRQLRSTTRLKSEGE
jgi:cell wall-associated NlpC family hydrolase